ncbi:MAG: phosphoadenosine phosphosulfate reductase family protein, partial [Candidatus Hydrogenedentes bacterium]|nr:phosphoadenosine phosphosulfate reductase family protein [Candidatus Hydrogenedentota bacterium]
RALATLDVWISGLRRDQSEGRKRVEKAAYIDQGGRKILKVNPLADWSEEQVWAYIKERDVPYNPLYDLGYTSIGCQICTTPTRPGEDKRAGRWRWFNALDHSKECGIHTAGSGI